VQLLWKIVEQFLKRLDIELPCNPAILLIGIYPKEMKIYVCIKTSIQMFIKALIIIASKWKQPKCLLPDEWISNIWYIHTMECYLAIQRNEVLTYATTGMKLVGSGIPK